jgi:adenine-specific DNA methylase
MIEKDYDVSFVAAIALREKQIQQNYRPVIAVHKWFARRPGTLFRSILLSEFGYGQLREIYFKTNDLTGLQVADPFMGGGTPLLEANRLGCDVIGYDINPMAYWTVHQEIASLDLHAYRQAADQLVAWLENKVGSFYKTQCLYCSAPDADVKYFLWVKTQACHHCGQNVDMIRLAVWQLRHIWKRDMAIEEKLAAVAGYIQNTGGFQSVEPCLGDDLLSAPRYQRAIVREDKATYGTNDDDISFCKQMSDLPKSQETLMQRPFELSTEELHERLEEMLQVTISVSRWPICDAP